VTTEPDLTETQKAYNVAQYEMFQLAAYGHCTYTNGELLTAEGKRQQADYNDRIRRAREELEAAVLRLVAEHAETSANSRFVSADWLRSLADDPAMLSLLAVRPDEREPVASVGSAPATDRAALSAKLWAIAEHHIVAEWICCEPLAPGHKLCAKGYAALGMVKTLLVDGDPEKTWNPSAPLLDAVLSVLPASSDRAAEWRSAADHIEAMRGYPSLMVPEEAVEELRRVADETRDEVVHGCPPDGSGLTPCCGRTPFELPLGDRISSEAPVTCPNAVVAQPAKEADNPRTVCVCGHTRGEHLVVSGRLLCDACHPDSTDNLVCKEFEAL
jgi:hypothetical protein